MNGFEQGDLLAAQAIEQVEEHADSEWMTAAKHVLWKIIQHGEDFTTDLMWERLNAMDVHTHEPRAMGAVMRAAARAGLIATTGEYVKSSRPDCHSRPIPVWRPKRKAAAA